jgi:hypothetical protein
MRSNSLPVVFILVITFCCREVSSFLAPQTQSAIQLIASRGSYNKNNPHLKQLFQMTTKEDNDIDELFRIIEESKGSITEEDVDEKVSQVVTSIESEFQAPVEPTPDRFEPLIGYYNVSYTLKAKKSDNPVGGKWTRSNGVAQTLLRTRRTLQHILPRNTTGLMKDPTAVGEAVNVISLEALLGLIRINVILRGDAIPLSDLPPSPKPLLPNLSNLAVRAFFDPPRIVFGKTGRFVNISVGPTSSVVLDTTFINERVRIGMGGTSGTKFVFGRCSGQDSEAREFLPLLQRKAASKIKAAAVLLSVTSAGLFGALRYGLKVLGASATVVSLGSLALILSSSGGIERDESYQPGR